MTGKRPAFLITIDTEGDNLWSRPREITTRNSRFLPRFQALCETYGMRPTYLVNYEMACCPAFQEFGREVLRQGTGEIGMHLHAWHSPPFVPLTGNDMLYQPYLMEYPEEVIREKIHAMTDLLEDTFGASIGSHRAGRWGFNTTYARLLAERGYRVDCSVTPGVSWRHMQGAPTGEGGCDYRTAPSQPYRLSAENVCRPGEGPLLEVPMTTRPALLGLPGRFAHRLGSRLPFKSAKRVINKVFPTTHWLRPDGRNAHGMQQLLKDCVADGAQHAEFMLHSSEFMPGGSPRFPTETHIEVLYGHLEQLFETAASTYDGMTLSAFAERVTGDRDAPFDVARENLAQVRT